MIQIHHLKCLFAHVALFGLSDRFLTSHECCRSYPEENICWNIEKNGRGRVFRSYTFPPRAPQSGSMKKISFIKRLEKLRRSSLQTKTGTAEPGTPLPPNNFPRCLVRAQASENHRSTPRTSAVKLTIPWEIHRNIPDWK